MKPPERLRGVETRPGGLRLRPRDAATLIILDTEGDEPRVLMGRRRSDLAFMAGKYVFPGGRVDPADARAPSVDDLPPPLCARLLTRMRNRASASRARALALAAIRETFEETGVLIGTEAEPPRPAPNAIWQAFVGHGVVPRLSGLRLIARAITPPGRPRRFDTRFFAAPAAAIARRLPLDEAPDGELEDIAWLTFDEAQALDLPSITHVVIDTLRADAADLARYGDHPPVPFHFMRHGRFVLDML